MPLPHTPISNSCRGHANCQVPGLHAEPRASCGWLGSERRRSFLAPAFSHARLGGNLAHGQAVWEARCYPALFHVEGGGRLPHTRHMHTHDSAHTRTTTCTQMPTMHTCALTTHAHTCTQATCTHGTQHARTRRAPPHTCTPAARRRLTARASPAVPGAGAGGEVPGAERAVRPAVAGPGEVPAARGEDRPAGQLHGPLGRPPAPQQAFPTIHERTGPLHRHR